MKLYEICQEIENLLGNMQIDTETGEVLIDFEALDALQMEKQTKIENIGKIMLNLRAEHQAIKERKEQYEKRMKALQTEIEKLLSYVDFCLKGEEFKSVDFQVKYTKSERVEIADKEAFLAWAKRHKHLLTVKEPEPNKNEIKKAIKNGEKVKFATIVQCKNIKLN